jgi:Ser/Thr protein kinase RdoA (MazF antagonist)
MRHLRASGFRCVPEPLGLDERGREIITLLPGRSATYPLPEFMWTDATLTAVAHLLRAFHDAGSSFIPPDGGRWQWPTEQPTEVVCHNDFGPYNLMFEDERLTGVIDLDLASPGPRGRDVAYAAYRFVSLTAPDNPDAPFRGEDEQHRRLAAFCGAYGHPQVESVGVLAAAVRKLEGLVNFIQLQAARGDPAQRHVLERGDVLIYERDMAHIKQLMS